MNEARYVIMRLEDAQALAKQAEASPKNLLQLFTSKADPEVQPIIDRLKAETGADIEEIVQLLKNSSNVYVQKQGRRLRRLLERANHLKPAGVEEPPREQYDVVTKKSHSALVDQARNHMLQGMELTTVLTEFVDVVKPLMINREWWINRVETKLEAYPESVQRLSRAISNLSYLERH